MVQLHVEKGVIKVTLQDEQNNLRDEIVKGCRGLMQSYAQYLAENGNSTVNTFLACEEMRKTFNETLWDVFGEEGMDMPDDFSDDEDMLDEFYQDPDEE